MPGRHVYITSVAFLFTESSQVIESGIVACEQKWLAYLESRAEVRSASTLIHHAGKKEYMCCPLTFTMSMLCFRKHDEHFLVRIKNTLFIGHEEQFEYEHFWSSLWGGRTFALLAKMYHH
jgi:hypothetical protein